MRREMENVVKNIIASGYQIEEGAFRLLSDVLSEGDFDSFVEELINRADKEEPKPITITKDFVMKVITELSDEKKSVEPVVEVSLKAKKLLAKEVDSSIEVLDDPTEKIGSEGNIDDFKHYFRDRFEKISNMLRKRLDARDAISIDRALEAAPRERVKIIAMVMNKKDSNRFLIFEVDDLESAAIVLVPREKNRQLLETAQNIVQDQILCIEAIRGTKDFLVAKNFILPEVPERKMNKADVPLYVALLSDIHIGSRTFLEESFNKLILWLNGKVGNSNQIEIAGKVKYVIIAGDLVDGIGVYPRQEEELAITDVYKQYELVAQYIEQIPDYIDVIIIPGNHDAVRQALPQPAIDKEYAEPIHEAKNVISLGNPAKIKLHGVTFLSYHGRSLDDVIATLPNLSFQNPEKAMEFLLKCRHLALEYGKRTSIAPMKEDHLVIDEPPDVFQAGHVHVMKHEVYRGISVINSGAWQGQTEYQKRMGLEPTPGILPLINLQSMNIKMINFMT